MSSLKKQMKFAVVKRPDGTLTKERDDEQWYYERVERMRKFNQDPSLALSHDIVQKPDGTYQLMKLSDAAKIMDGAGNSSSSFVQGYTGMVGLNRTRGKYNDENRLFEQDSASIKVGEVEEWARI